MKIVTFAHLFRKLSIKNFFLLIYIITTLYFTFISTKSTKIFLLPRENSISFFEKKGISEQKQFKYNQKNDYPNTSEAPVSSEDMANTSYIPPMFSKCLFEESPLRKLRQKDFISTIKYAIYQLSRGELEQIFNFADMNHDDLIDHKEWDAFVTLFILPFEACDKNADYLLDESELEACFAADPRSRLVRFPQKFEEQKIKIIMDIISTRKIGDLNFSDYLILRRALFGWKECQSTPEVISITAFRCALKSAIPIKYHLKLDAENIYKAGLKISNRKGDTDLDFISYLRVLYYAYVFSILNMPNDTAFLDKTQFIKAVKEDRFPTFFSEDEIEAFYEFTNINPMQLVNPPMGFGSFCFFFGFHRLFHKYSQKEEQQINLEELNDLIEDYLFPSAYRFAIDRSKTNFNKTDYLEVSLVLQRTRLNERDFYFSFREKQNQQTVNIF